jgi:hypothetical protein
MTLIKTIDEGAAQPDAFTSMPSTTEALRAE